jgi:trk system potassium uptake protein TrkH
MLAPAFYAASIADPKAGNYFFSAAATVFMGGGLTMLAGEGDAGADFRTTLSIIFLWWAATPLFAAGPFILEGWTLVDAYFEAASALTTTGATLQAGDLIDRPVDFLWRAILQWIGGLSSLAIAAAIFIRPVFLGTDTVLPSFTRGERDSYVHAVILAARAFAPPYAAVTVVLFIALSAAGTPQFEAFALAMSTVASGGLTAHASGVAGAAPVIGLVLFPFILLSGANFILIDRGARGNFAAIRDEETVTFLAIVAIVGLVMYFLRNSGSAGAAIFNSASLFATNGVMIGEPPDLILALVTVIIGGCAVSTAGGLKILRWMVIMRRAQSEIRRLILPSAVFRLRDAANELGVWMHFLVFTILLGALTAMVAAGGHSLESSVAGAVGVLANAGPVIGLTESGSEGYRIFDDAPVKLILAAGMILGRLEGVAALMLINRAFWRS